ncbi:hypothetical protein A500_16305 [Clostridium sartagoforme AAU1]|uniref:Uncharacterized protein n=1 Tax=Clostridium sartagoforme AAU1 TaxID=1202534 RepID=R9BV27_9CLOT|nr:hypothetical protein [Clostridium sartagoforme]EOR20570.1 hypothetical protein A500_16305 [Clostridium sartagoforme AAU1]
MTKKELMIKAHKMTKEIKAQYPTVDYKFQLGLCLAYLQEGGNEMVELKGSEKQVAWANNIREVVMSGVNALLAERQQAHEERGKKRTLRMLEEAKAAKEKLENEESAKYYIDNFAYALKKMNDYKLESELSKVNLDLVIGYAVKETLGL